MYDADYFLRGLETGKSLYVDYHWLPELTIPMCNAIVKHLGIKGQSVLDFGCARGYTVKALHQLGYDARGVDVSTWALDNCDPDVKDFVSSKLSFVDWIIAKDVLEHIPQVVETINDLLLHARIGVFVVVPLSDMDNHPYVVSDYEKDVTHFHRLTLASWVRMFLRPGWSIEARYRILGVKDNYNDWTTGNGFITARRL